MNIINATLGKSVTGSSTFTKRICRRYESYDQLLPELQKHMPGYEKTKRYFIRTNLYKYLTKNRDLKRAMVSAEKLCLLCKETPEDFMTYSEIDKIIK